MRIVKESTLKEYIQQYPDARSGLEHLLMIASDAEWADIQDVRQAFPHADAAEVASGNIVTIFNIGGNQYRLIVSIKYRYGMIYIRDFLTHAEYDKGHWKKRH